MNTLLRSLALLFCAAVAAAAQPGAARPVRILTVGNSFADNMLRFLPELAAAGGRSVVVGRANVSGCSLQRHWEAVAAGLAGQAAESRIYPAAASGARRSLEDALTEDEWDVVTIQQASRLSDDEASYRPWAERLVAHLRQRAPRAAIALHQTWAYRWDDPRFSAGSSPAEMHAGIRNACHRLAGELGLSVIPVGEAFHRASLTPEWTYRPEAGFDFTRSVPERLPEQAGSLHVGWRWSLPERGPRRMYLDAHHANAAGAYLAGCVLYGFLFGCSPLGNGFHPAELTPDQARSLQAIAADTLAEAGPSASKSQ